MPFFCGPYTKAPTTHRDAPPHTRRDRSIQSHATPHRIPAETGARVSSLGQCRSDTTPASSFVSSASFVNSGCAVGICVMLLYLPDGGGSRAMRRAGDCPTWEVA